MATEKLNKTETHFLTVVETQGGMYINQTHTTLSEAILFIVTSLENLPGKKFDIYSCKKII